MPTSDAGSAGSMGSLSRVQNSSSRRPSGRGFTKKENMTDKAKDHRVKSVVPPDEAGYHETSVLFPEKAGQTDVMSLGSPTSETFQC